MKAFVVMCCALLLAVAIAEPAVPQSAQAQLNDVERRKAEVAASLEGATEEVKQAGMVLAETELLIPGAESSMSIAEGRVAAAEVREAEAHREAKIASATFDEANETRDKAQAAVAQARDERADILSATYRGVELHALSAVLDADELSTTVDRLSYFKFIADSKQHAVEEVTLKRAEATNARNEASMASKAAEAAKRDAENAADEARQRRDEAAEAYNALISLKDRHSAALKVAEDNRGAFQAQLAKLERESAALAERIRIASQNTPPPPPSTGSSAGGVSAFVQPVSGWKSSDYGWRRHPIYGGRTYHGGVDFAAGTGTNIYAAASGTVIYAGWNGGYGLLTCIDHGGGTSTCYGHQSSIYVSNGQWVGANSAIGAVGSTGQSTGPHLHFEVRKWGSQVNPIPYLPSCLCR